LPERWVDIEILDGQCPVVARLLSGHLVLTDDEKEALIALLKRTIEYARFPLAPRLDPLKAILAKLDPPPPQPESLPPLPSGAASRVGRGRRR
jgi:hypothetical protein